jgi:NAD(P)-dependent dehydrogenase (short-subunit alcohol dehydrogenase family)
MNLQNKHVVVTGGSRGLGLGLVEALVAKGAKVSVVARDSQELESLKRRLGVAVISADVTDQTKAHTILSDLKPDILVLNAGTPPHMASLDQITWEDFSVVWEVDVKAGLYWMQAALNLPLNTESRILVLSSGAAISGSPRSGGYGGAKRMLWLMANYANGIAAQKQLGMRFQVIVPRQIVLGTGIGDAGAKAYAAAANTTPEEFVTRFGTPMPPRDFGEKVVTVLCDPQYAEGFAFGLNGETGISILEGMTL